MVNNESIHGTNTLYTTPRMVVGSVSGDVIWQMFSQFIDPYIEDESLGKLNAIDLTSIVYPIFIAGLIYMGLRYKPEYAKPAAGATEKEEKDYKKGIAEDREIGMAVLLGMVGWMGGYYLSEEGLGAGDYETSVIVGVATAIPLLMYSYWNDRHADKPPIPLSTYLLAATSFFLGGMFWHLCYMLPSIMMEHGFPVNPVAGGFVSAYATGIASAASLAVLNFSSNPGSQENTTDQKPHPTLA